MILRHNRCWGLLVHRFGNKQIEVWFCPKGETIVDHFHAKIDSKIIYLGGKMDGHITHKHKQFGWRDLFRAYPIPRGTVHGAKVTGLFALFANVETWPDKTITSAACDFKRV